MMLSGARTLLLILLCCSSMPWAHAFTELDRITSLVSENRERLQAVHVTYTVFSVPQADDYHLQVEFAAKGVKRHASRTKITSLGIDPFQFASFYDGKSWNVYSPKLAKYEVSQKFAIDSHTFKVRGHAFAEALRWWPPEDDSQVLRSGEQRLFLHDVLADPALESLGNRVISGLECVGYRSGDLSVWMDRELGLLRETNWNIRGKDRSLTTSLLDYRSVKNDVQLPYLIRRSLGENDGQEFRVLSYKINQEVLEDVFEFSPPAGTLVVDRDTDTLKQIPGGIDFLDRTANELRRMYRYAPYTDISMRQLEFYGASSMGVFLTCVLLVWHRRREPNTRQANDGSHR